jgi:hypothetical protein
MRSISRMMVSSALPCGNSVSLIAESTAIASIPPALRSRRSPSTSILALRTNDPKSTLPKLDLPMTSSENPRTASKAARSSRSRVTLHAGEGLQFIWVTTQPRT